MQTGDKEIWNELRAEVATTDKHLSFYYASGACPKCNTDVYEGYVAKFGGCPHCSWQGQPYDLINTGEGWYCAGKK